MRCEGARCARRKGSPDNITAWNEELRWAWTWLRGYRAERLKAHARPCAGSRHTTDHRSIRDHELQVVQQPTLPSNEDLAFSDDASESPETA